MKLPKLNLNLNTHQVNPYDPGICTKRKRGKFVVVRDRNDDDKIVVCFQHHGKYQWDMINGILISFKTSLYLNITRFLFLFTVRLFEVKC